MRNQKRVPQIFKMKVTVPRISIPQMAERILSWFGPANADNCAAAASKAAKMAFEFGDNFYKDVAGHLLAMGTNRKSRRAA